MKSEEESYLQYGRKYREFRDLVEGGLRFISFGACCLVATVFVGLFLYAFQSGVVWAETFRTDQQRETVVTLTQSAIVVIIAAGFLCMVLGLWRCLVNAPDYDHARETMFLCVVAFLIGTMFLGFSLWLGGTTHFLQLHLHINRWQFDGTMPPATLLQVIGIALYVFSLFAFNNHLMILHDGLKNVKRHWLLKLLDMYLIFTSLLVGGFVGALMSWSFLRDHPEFIVALLVCSLIDFCWFLLRVRSVRSLLIDPKLLPNDQTDSAFTAENTPKCLSGVRRVLKAMQK